MCAKNQKDYFRSGPFRFSGPFSPTPDTGLSLEYEGEEGTGGLSESLFG